MNPLLPLTLHGLSLAAFHLKGLQPQILAPNLNPPGTKEPLWGQLWQQAIGWVWRQSLQLPLLPSSKHLEQEQLPSLCLWPALSWCFLALSWLPGSAPARCPLQGLRVLGLCVQARPSRDWSKPAHLWQLH